MVFLTLRWLVAYRPLKTQYQETYPKLTSADFWQEQFGADQIRSAAE